VRRPRGGGGGGAQSTPLAHHRKPTHTQSALNFSRASTATHRSAPAAAAAAHAADFADARAAALFSFVVAGWAGGDARVEAAWDRARGVLQVRAPLLPGPLREPPPTLCVALGGDPLPALGALASLSVRRNCPGDALGAPGAALAALAAAAEGMGD